MVEYHADTEYLGSLEKILDNGITRTDRTGVGTIGIFGSQEVYDLTKGFPLLTTKRIYTRGVIEELLFFLNGRTDNQWLNARKTHIWDEWTPENGDLGPVYGYQWREFGSEFVPQHDRDSGIVPSGGTDQIMNALSELKNNPFSRRIVVSAWNPSQLSEMALPPCHLLFQFYVTPDEDGNPYGLSVQLYQRSRDTFLGSPFNIASYSVLTHLFADLVGLKPVSFVHTTGDAHIYLNHLDQVKEQLSRRNNLRPMPTLKITHPFDLAEVDLSDKNLFKNYTADNFVFEGYDPHSTIKAPVAV